LTSALQRQSSHGVRQALLADGADAAMLPVEGMRGQPPLCFAIEERCYHTNILMLLLKHGADAEGWDTYGRTPLSLLALTDVKVDAIANVVPSWVLPPLTTPPAFVFPWENLVPSLSRQLPCTETSQVRFATLLVARGGADPLRHDGCGDLPATLALKAGKSRLACFLSHHGGVQASVTFSRIRSFDHALVWYICTFLVPDCVLQKVSQLSDFNRP
jgi:hypothetical protein